ncbi:MAG: hypothetical protein P1V51_22900 [Deltaproteobacteria bacterium]|nr:hypothetical protein [Deltaproteobacteria bacterium]
MNERRFGEAEIELILQRAVQLEVISEILGGREHEGLTLREVQEIAREAGIDPNLVARAAWELEAHRLEADQSMGESKRRSILPSSLAQA